MSTDTIYVDTRAGLNALCTRLQGQPWIALDTEFMRERTYYPELCLIQVATVDVVACVDNLAVPQLDPLLAVLLDKRSVKVLHAARQDLEIFFHLTGQVPAPVFDTQIAARFLGLPDQAGYGALVQTLLGVSLDKSMARTDWARRPLPPAAVEYAADDVRHLRDLYARILNDLESRERSAWPEPELKALTDERLYRPDPDNAWQRVRGIQRMKPKALAIVKALAAWRERTAMQENRPRQWILKDETLMDLAKQCPASLADLAAMRGLGDGLAKRHGETLLKLLAADGGGDGAPLPRPPPPLSTRQEALVDALVAVLRLKAAVANVSPPSLATRADLERLVRGERELELLKDWRMEAAGRDLLAFLEGKQSLTAAAEGLQLIPRP
jgi:ribonuclease D